MKIKSVVLCLVFMLLINSFCVFGAEVYKDVNISYNCETGVVNIEGTLASDVSGTVARLMVLRPGTDASKLIDGTLSFKQCGIHASETVISDKAFEFAPFLITDVYEAGDYIIRIAAGSEIYTDTLSVASVNQATKFLIECEDEEEMKGYIEKYNHIYQLDTDNKSLYGEFDEAGKTYILKQMCDYEAKALADFKEEFLGQTVLYKVYTGPWGVLEDIILSNSDVLSVDTDDFEKLTTSNRDGVCKDLCGNLYNNSESFKSAFEEMVEEAFEKQSSDKKNNSSGGSGGLGGTKTYFNEIETQPEEPKPTETPREVFYDLANHAWAKSSIELLNEKGIVNGRENGIFAPDDFVTRAEAVKMVVLALGETDVDAKCEFSDVDIDSWAYPYIASATENGIIYGYDDGKFGINDRITREDLAVIVMRAALKYNVNIEEKIKDVDFADSDSISVYAREAVSSLSEAGIINGMDGLFNPKAYATRAMTAKIIASIIS